MKRFEASEWGKYRQGSLMVDVGGEGWRIKVTTVFPVRVILDGR